jgi:tripeptide aminopeptidase
LSPSYFKDLLQYKGQTLITTDGTTLLGADDKAGITEIVTIIPCIKIRHGKIRSVSHLMKKLDVAHTTDVEIWS